MQSKRMSLGLGGKVLLTGAAVTLLLAGSVVLATVAGWDVNLCVGAAVILSLALSAVASRQVSAPIRRVVDAAMAFDPKQDPSELAAVAGDFEVGEMAEALVAALSGPSKETEFYKNGLRSLVNPVVVTDAQGHILLATQAVSDLLEKPMTQIIGFTVGQSFFGETGSSLTEEALETCQALDRMSEMTLWDGRQITLRGYCGVITGEDGELIGSVSSFIDMHTVLEKQSELEESQRQMLSVGKDVSDLAQRVASASEELSASADEQAAGAQRQKEQTDTVATAMEEMTATVLEVAQNASATSNAANEAEVKAEEGMQMVGKAVDAINGVSQSADRLSEMVRQLDNQAGEIGRIIAVINDIADQTNLLALNAAIEAARAGEAGRGFAVVADEVRKLAEKTMTATKEVESAIKTIQDRSRLTLSSMEETGEQVAQSTDLANKAGEALQMIRGSIDDMVLRASQIATAAEEQSAAAEEINQSIESIAQVAAESDEGAGQTAAATRDLAELSQELLNVSMNFTQGGGELKLRESDEAMRGVLPKIMQDFVKEKYARYYDELQDGMGHPVFLPTAAYPHQVMFQMAEFLADKSGSSVHDVFIEFGRYTVLQFHKMYPRYFKDESLKSFYLRMNDVHAQLTKQQPGIHPPNFTYEDKGDVLFMNYRSRRGMFDYFEGILRGAAEFKGERVAVKMVPLDEATVRAEITFL